MSKGGKHAREEARRVTELAGQVGLQRPSPVSCVHCGKRRRQIYSDILLGLVCGPCYVAAVTAAHNVAGQLAEDIRQYWVALDNGWAARDYTEDPDSERAVDWESEVPF